MANNLFEWEDPNEFLKEPKRDHIFKTALPQLTEATKLFVSLYTNNRNTRRALNSLRPTLKTTYEKYSPITGDFATKLFYNQEAAKVQLQAARPLTSDASLLMAAQFQAADLASLLRAKGELLDNQAIAKSREQALQNQWDNQARRTAVADENRATLNKYTEMAASLKNQRYYKNYNAISTYMTNATKSYISQLAEQQAKRDSINKEVSSAAVEAENLRLNTELQLWILDYEKENPNGDYTTDLQYLNITKNIKRSLIDEYMYNLKISNGLQAVKPMKYSVGKYTKFRSGGKFQDGGLFLTDYTPGDYTFATKPTTQPQSQAAAKAKSDKDDDDFNFLKEVVQAMGKIEGLESDKELSKVQFTKVLKLINRGARPATIAAAYMEAMSLLDTNKKAANRFDKIYDTLKNDLALAAPAILESGLVVVRDENGSLTARSPEEITGEEHIVTNAELLRLRSTNTTYINDKHLMDWSANGISLSKVNTWIKERLQNPGSVDTSVTTLMTFDGLQIQIYNDLDVKNGMNILATIYQSNQLAATTGQHTADLYKIMQEDKNSRVQVQKALYYIYSTLPENARTLLKLQTKGKTDKEAQQLILNYIESGVSETHKKSIDYEGGVNFKGKSGKGSGSGETDDLKDKMTMAAAGYLGYGNKEDFVINLGRSESFAVRANSVVMNDASGNPIKMMSSIKDVSGGEFADLDYNNMSIGGELVNPLYADAILTRDTHMYFLDFPVLIKEDGTITNLPDFKYSLLMKTAKEQLKQLGIDLADADSIKKNYQKINKVFLQNQLPAVYDSLGNLTHYYKRFCVTGVIAPELVISEDTYMPALQESKDKTINKQYEAIIKSHFGNTLGIDVLDRASVFEWSYDSLYNTQVWIPVKDSFMALNNERLKIGSGVLIGDLEEAHRNKLRYAANHKTPPQRQE